MVGGLSYFSLFIHSLTLTPNSMLYLRYRNTLSDTWTEVPLLTTVYPGQPLGSVPAETLRLYSTTEFETPCGCPETMTTEDRYALRATLKPLPQASMPGLAKFLLRYKQANYHEALHPLFGDGVYYSAQLSLLNIKQENSLSTIEFRLAAMIVDVI